MLTCFINTTRKEEWYSNVSIVLFMLLPLCMFVYGLVEAISIYRHIKKQKEKEMERLFFKYGIFIGMYILLTTFLFVVFIWDFFIDFSYGLTKTFRWTAFFVTVCWASTPLIVGILRFIHLYIKSDFIFCRKCNKNNDLLKEQILLIDGSPQSELFKSSIQDIEKFEKKAVKRVTISI